MIPSTAAVAAAAAPLPAANASRRRAADVLILGGGLQARAAAYLLAKRGKRTVLVEHAAPQLAPAAGSSGVPPHLVLHLPAATPHLVNEATEAFALWRGVEAASGARSLLHLCGSIDIAPAGSGAAAAALGAMQEAGRAAGLPFGMLTAEEVGAAFPRLRPPRGAAAVFTNLGGVVQGRVAAAALLAMAQRAGADVAAGRCLLGWCDAGSHFAVRTAGSAAAAAAGGGEDEVVYECEQLLLMPEAAVQRQALALFGLAVAGASLWSVPAGRWGAPEECGALPVWQLLGSGSTRTVDDPTAVDSCWGLPLLEWGPPRSLLVSQGSAGGEPAEQPQQQQGQQQDAASAADGASGGGGSDLRQQEAAVTAVLAGAAAEDLAELAAGGLVERPGSEEAQDAERQREADEQQQLLRAQRRLGAAGGLAGRLVRGLGGRLPGRDTSQQFIVTPDGELAVGSHPGYDPGRIVVAFPATASALGCLPGDQLAPLVARLAMNELLGQPPEAVDAAAVSLGREALQAQAAALQHDTWAELSLSL